MLFQRISLYISSYLPLYCLLIYKGYSEISGISLSESAMDKGNVIYFLTLFICIICSLVTIAIFVYKPTNKNEPIIGKFTTTGDNIISYIMTYLTPMLSLEVTNVSSIFINVSLFILIGCLYVRSNLIYLNPVLSLLGYHVFEWENEGATRVIITKLSLAELNVMIHQGNQKVQARKFKNNIWLYRKQKD